MSKLKLTSMLGVAFVLLSIVPRAEAQGHARYIKRAGTEFDPYTNAPSAAQQQWMRDHFSRMVGVFSPYFDQKLSWFPNAWVYIDLYAIAKNSPVVSQHPDWILHNASGAMMYVPWGCSGGTCPQYAGDVSNPNFRRWWIDQAKLILAKGYKGIWLDDVNMQMRVGDTNGNEVPPIDPNTKNTMIGDDWRRYIAEYTEQIRAELPGIEIMHNSIWFAGPSGIRDVDPYIQRQISAADYINCERGISDSGLTGGTGEWSLSAFFSYVDRIHAKGKSVVFDDYFPTGLEYPLAGYLLIANGTDGMGELISTPNNWWKGYDIDLGTASGARYSWNGLLRRDFQRGIVLLNEPGSPSRTVTLPGLYTTVDGFQVSSITLGASQGAVLQAVAVAPPVSGGGNLFVSDLTPISSTNGWGPLEKDRSNNTAVGGDGNPLTLNGVTYSKGLGVHANSDVQYNLGGVCNAFTASVGVDGEVPNGLGSIVFQVWADGTKLYDSGRVTRGDATKIVNVGISGRQQLELVVTDNGDGITWDHGDWANAVINCTSTPITTAATTYLTDLTWTSATNGWGPVEKNTSVGEAAAGDGHVMKLRGKLYQKGLGVHATSDVKYNLGQVCSTFQADVGVDDEVAFGAGSIVFQVWADGVKLYDSGLVTSLSPVQTINVLLTGRSQLELLVTDGGNGITWDHGDWADARVTCSGKLP